MAVRWRQPARRRRFVRQAPAYRSGPGQCSASSCRSPPRTTRRNTHATTRRPTRSLRAQTARRPRRRQL